MVLKKSYQLFSRTKLYLRTQIWWVVSYAYSREMCYTNVHLCMI